MDATEDQIEDPDFRATIRRRRVLLTAWIPFLASGGPFGAVVRERAEDGVALADLTVVQDHEGLADELIVDFVAGNSSDARRALLRWATRAGYGRVWLPDEVVEVDGAGSVGRPASTQCLNCGARFCDGDADFWVAVRRAGAFPTLCAVCGADLPQWTIRRRVSQRDLQPRNRTPRPD